MIWHSNPKEPDATFESFINKALAQVSFVTTDSARSPRLPLRAMIWHRNPKEHDATFETFLNTAPAHAIRCRRPVTPISQQGLYSRYLSTNSLNFSVDPWGGILQHTLNKRMHAYNGNAVLRLFPTELGLHSRVILQLDSLIPKTVVSPRYSLNTLLHHRQAALSHPLIPHSHIEVRDLKQLPLTTPQSTGHKTTARTGRRVRFSDPQCIPQHYRKPPPKE